MVKDYLVDCPLCGEQKACYAINANKNHKQFMCLGCGYQGSDFIVEGNYDVEEYEKQLPELYKDMKQVDKENRVWYPSAVNIQEKGTVFMSGTSKDDVEWCAIQAIELTEEEKKLPKFKGYTHKSNPSSMKKFGTDYLSALEYIELDF